MVTHGSPEAEEETGLADTGANDATGVIAGAATALVVTGGATAVAVRRRRLKRTQEVGDGRSREEVFCRPRSTRASSVMEGSP
ncbi:LAETG motif-containing sortase-dependent surface protein [Streptomyces sp. NPDC045714]|uniref:LAETG motif-containing sortase-dependent surface protein n=1 Tax=Streptomyces sp. NPDC045714 TaxID=3154913 RepID=UPI0033F46EB8